MPDQTISIRVRGEDDGSVRRVMRNIAKESDDAAKRIRASSSEVFGPLKPGRFAGDEQLMRNEKARLLREVRADTELAARRERAESISRSARRELFGDEPEKLAVAARETGRASGRALSEGIVAGSRGTGERVADETSKSFLHRLKSVAGGRGTIKDYAEVLTGGGAVAGLTFVGRAIKDAAENAVKLNDEFNAGKINAGQMIEQLARGVPVFGNFFAAGRSIRELFTGEEASAREILASAERMNRLIDARATSIKEIKDSAAGFAAIAKSIDDRRESGELELVNPASRRNFFQRLLSARREFVDESDKINKTRLADLEKTLGPLKAALKEQQDLENSLRSSIPTVPGLSVHDVGGAFAPAQADNRRDIAVAQQQLADHTQKMKAAAAQVESLKKQILDATSAITTGAQPAITKNSAALVSESRRALGEYLTVTIGGFARAGAESAKSFWQRFIETDEGHRREVQARLDDAATSSRLAALDREAAAGDEAASKEALRLRIHQEFVRQERELQAILRDQAASEEQKRQARQQIRALGRDEAAANRRQITSSAEATLPQLVEARFLSGLPGPSRSDPVVEKTAEVADNTKEITEKVDALPDDLLKTFAPTFIDRLVSAFKQTGSTPLFEPN